MQLFIVIADVSKRDYKIEYQIIYVSTDKRIADYYVKCVESKWRYVDIIPINEEELNKPLAKFICEYVE